MYFYNLKNAKNTHGWMLILVKVQALAYNLLKVTLLHGRFSHFLNCTNGTKSRNVSHIIYFVIYFEITGVYKSFYLCLFDIHETGTWLV